MAAGNTSGCFMSKPLENSGSWRSGSGRALRLPGHWLLTSSDVRLSWKPSWRAETGDVSHVLNDPTMVW